MGNKRENNETVKEDEEDGSSRIMKKALMMAPQFLEGQSLK